MGNQLHAGRPGADQRHAFVRELVQATVGAPAGVVVVPAGGVEHMAREVLDAGDTGQLRAVVRALRHDDEPRPDLVTAVGGDQPAFGSVVPLQFPHLCGEQRTVVEAEVLADVAAVSEDLCAVGELLRRHEAEFLEHRDVAVRVVVTLDSGEAVPVPHAPEVAGHLDDAHALDTGLLQVRPGQESGESSAEDHDVGGLDDRVPLRDRRVGIDLGEVGEVVGEFQILTGAFRAQALRPLLRVLLPQRVDVDVVRGVGGPAGNMFLLSGDFGAAGRAQRDSARRNHRVRGAPVPMYLASWWCRLTVLRSR